MAALAFRSDDGRSDSFHGPRCRTWLPRTTPWRSCPAIASKPKGNLHGERPFPMLPGQAFLANALPGRQADPVRSDALLPFHGCAVPSKAMSPPQAIAANPHDAKSLPGRQASPVRADAASPGDTRLGHWVQSSPWLPCTTPWHSSLSKPTQSSSRPSQGKPPVHAFAATVGQNVRNQNTAMHSIAAPAGPCKRRPLSHTKR
jgi:hypothetical protein